MQRYKPLSIASPIAHTKMDSPDGFISLLTILDLIHMQMQWCNVYTSLGSITKSTEEKGQLNRIHFTADTIRFHPQMERHIKPL